MFLSSGVSHLHSLMFKFMPMLLTDVPRFARVVTVSPTDSVLTATKKMLELKLSATVIAVDKKPRGILTYVVLFVRIYSSNREYHPLLFCLSDKFVFINSSSRDILMRVIAQNLSPESTPVEKVGFLFERLISVVIVDKIVVQAGRIAHSTFIVQSRLKDQSINLSPF